MFTKAVADHRRCPWPRREGFCLDPATWCQDVFVRCLPAIKYRIDPVLPNRILRDSNLDHPGNRCVRQEDRHGKLREDEATSVIGIDGSWNHQRKGSARILDMVDVESRRVADFEIVHRTIASGGATTREAVMEWNGSGTNEVNSEEMGK
jgi:hypothetical protein